MIPANVKASSDNVCRTRRCLALIRDIAGRGALASDPEHVGYALQELSQILLERTGVEERQFEPVSATSLAGLEMLQDELEFADGCLRDMARKDAQRNHGQWN